MNALCFYGQPRSLRQAVNGIKNHLINANSVVDVYQHGWFDSSKVGSLYCTDKNADGSDTMPNSLITEDIPSVIYELYNPKILKLEKQIVFDNTEYLKSFPSPKVTFSTLSLFYSIGQAISLIDSKYEHVMITRTDLGCNSDIKMNAEYKTIYFIDDCCHHNGVNDWFIGGRCEDMKKLSEIFAYLPEISKKVEFLPEKVLHYFVTNICGFKVSPSFRAGKLIR